MENLSIEAMIAGATPRPTTAEEVLRSVPTRYLTKAILPASPQRVITVDGEGIESR